jgi:hypothetical protein
MDASDWTSLREIAGRLRARDTSTVNYGEKRVADDLRKGGAGG